MMDFMHNPQDVVAQSTVIKSNKSEFNENNSSNSNANHNQLTNQPHNPDPKPTHLPTIY